MILPLSERRPFITITIDIAAALGACLCSTFVPAATPAESAPNYAAFSSSYHIPFSQTKPMDFDHLDSMHVRVSLNGGPPTRFQVDTGSVGIIVGATEVPNIDPKAPPGSITYSSSGIELDGVWTPVTVTFLDSKDAHGNLATAVVPVLAAMETRSTGVGVNAGQPKPPTKNPKPHMFGIGFGRGKEAHPERNPFINLKEMQDGKMRRGYTITRDGYALGLTPDGVGADYAFQHLKERVVSSETAAMKPGLKDWETSRGWVSVGNDRQPEMPILLDTGLTNMMIPRANLAAYTEIAAGTPITVNLLGGQLHYSFTVGDKADPVSPRRVTWFPATPTSNVNTGLRALAAFDYLYDADGGYLGLRPTGKHP